jgi:hypothetical protein
VGAWVAEHVIGPRFVANIAGKTLRRVKQIAEADSAATRAASRAAGPPG